MSFLVHLGRAWLLVLACLYGCRYLVSLFELKLPAAIVAMLLLFTLLATGLVKEQWIKPACQPLLHWMGLFFVPAGVGVIDHLPLLQQEGPALMAAATLSTALIIVTVGHLYQGWNAKP